MNTFFGLNLDGYLGKIGLPILASWALKGFSVSHALGEDDFEERRVQQFLVVQSGEIETRDPFCTKCGKEIFGPVDGDQFGTLSILHFMGAVRCF